MLNRIFKCPLVVTDRQTITSTGSIARFLDAQHQNGMLCVWYEVEDSAAVSHVEMHIVGTGSPMPDGAIEYVGTVQDGPMVWHIFHGRIDVAFPEVKS